MGRKAVLVCIDGCGPEYLQEARFIRRADYFSEGWSVIPSVTNVNNVSIITGEYPEAHGITSNYYYDRATEREVYMESPEFIRSKTILERAAGLGLKTALLTSKDKLRLLLGRGAAVSFSAEKPPSWLVEEIGAPPHIYSIDVNIWLFKAAERVAARERPDLMYVATTDYAMHKYGPEHPESRRHIRGIDEGLQRLAEAYEKRGDELLLCVTADHGMSGKNMAVNLELILKRNNIDAKMNMIIADRYVAHHSNMGGAVYIYLEKTGDVYRALELLQDVEGVEVVLTRRQAARLFHLDEERIGDLMVLARKNYVFGLVDREICEISLRSHGSLHEGRVPIMVFGTTPGRMPRENRELAHLVIDWLTMEKRA